MCYQAPLYAFFIVSLSTPYLYFIVKETLDCKVWNEMTRNRGVHGWKEVWLLINERELGSLISWEEKYVSNVDLAPNKTS